MKKLRYSNCPQCHGKIFPLSPDHWICKKCNIDIWNIKWSGEPEKKINMRFKKMMNKYQKKILKEISRKYKQPRLLDPSQLEYHITVDPARE